MTLANESKLVALLSVLPLAQTAENFAVAYIVGRFINLHSFSTFLWPLGP